VPFGATSNKILLAQQEALTTNVGEHVLGIYANYVLASVDAKDETMACTAGQTARAARQNVSCRKANKPL